MTYKDILPQLEGKAGKKQKFKKHNTPKNRKHGRSKRKCRRCGRQSSGIVRQYDLYFCRQCMREVGRRVGFEKYV